ncbi:MAG TPA: endo-1,4-beta-xylanase, partial [Chthoniobacteraceae bacterium]|nr:endo-1,4-beta-xylanase [Chthoniobacteraceae bacterium]
MRIPLLFCLVALMGSGSFADDKPLPAGGVALVEQGALKQFGDPVTVRPMQVVQVNGEPFKQALHIQTLAETPTPYSIQLGAKTAVAIHEGDVLFARYYLRCVETKSETGTGATEMVIEQGAPDYRKLVTFPASAGAEWKEFCMPFVATKENIGGTEIAAGAANVLFRLGYGAQTIEIGGVEILDFGNKVRVQDLPQPNISYVGREADAPWRKEAEARIEQIRKGDLAVIVKGADGRPVAGASVKVEMKRHAFGFGSAVSAEMLLAKTPDGDKYREVVSKYFNKVVLENDLKWWMWEADRQRAVDAVKWLRDRDIEVRGHNLVWPSWHNLPRDLETLKDNPDALRKRIDGHITEEVTAIKGQCVEWDVINELFANHDVTDILGKQETVRWFQLAHQADPAAKLFINDYDTVESGRADNPHTDAFEEQIRYLLANGAPVSGIGIQSHFGWALPAPAAVQKGFERFAKLGLEMEITEEDVSVTDEQLQADYTRDYMTLAFSEPSMVGFLSWGFWEGRHWRSDAAYFRKDWSVKPAWQAWIDLVTKKWWTNASGATDAQ